MRAPSTARGWAAFGIVAMVLIVALAVTTARFGVLTPQGRLLIEATTSGLKLGRFGKLKLEGLGGDLWRDFTVRKLTVSDEKGVWLQADDLDIRWSYARLLGRRLQIDQITMRQMTVLRRPTLSPKGPPSKGLPVTVDIGAARFRLQTLPAFSARPGLYDVSAKVSLDRRAAGQAGQVSIASLMHQGDRLDLKFDVGRTRPLLVDAHGMEAQGGALAGAFGLPANQPFRVDAHVVGAATGSGRIDLDLVSGARTPVTAHGGWTPQGGAGSGSVALDASTLTAPFAARIGRVAAVAVAARRARDGRYGVAALVKAPNLGLAVQGAADLKTMRAESGLKTAVVVADLSRAIGRKGFGAGQAQGLLTGGLDDWRFAGTGSVSGLEQSGYRLARASGPLTVSGRKKEITVKAAFAGAGGSGGGLTAALLGPGPKASAEVVRLADGRMLIRKADALGQGLKVTATGSVGLFGALSFKGELEATGLNRVRPGAAGSVAASWTASQGGANKPWLVTVDGRGKDFRSSLPELDRLLGAEPRLQLKAAWADGVLAVANASLTGAKASASGQGKIDPRGPLALQAQWRAAGPFQAGPVQISGEVSGKGAVTGTLSAPRADLDADFAEIDIPQLPLKSTHVHLAFLSGPGGFTGQVALNGQSGYGPARARSDFRFAAGGLDLSGIDADAGGVRATGALALRGSEPSRADLQLAIGPGAVLSAGQITGSVKLVDGPQPVATLALQASEAALKGSGLVLHSARVSGSGPLGRLPFQVTGSAETPQGPLSLDASGLYQQTGASRQVTLNGAGKFKQVEFKTTEPIVLGMAGENRTARLRLAIGGGQLSFDMKQVRGAADATGSLKGVDLKTVDQDWVGRVDADFGLHGAGSRLGGTLTARLDDARSADAPKDVAVDAVIRAALSGDKLNVDAVATGGGGMRSNAFVTLPVVASAQPLHLAIVRNKPMQGRFSAEGEVRPLWNLVYGSERELAGQVKLQGALAGTLNDPLLTGDGSVTGGRFRDFSTGLVLTSLAMDVDLNRDAVLLKSLSAKDEKNGTISGSGEFSLQRGGASTLKLDMQKFRLIDNDTAEAIATGQMTFTRAADGKLKIAGELGLERAEINAETKLRPSVASIDVIERNQPEALKVQMKPAAARGPPITLDVKLKASRGVIVRGRGLNLELSLDAQVSGALASPALSGTAHVVKGDYDFAGKRFEFDEDSTIRLGNTPEQIRLDLSATWEAPTLTATVRIHGTAAKPEITLASTPSLPQEEILAQVLFGDSASSLSRAETAQLASTVTALATGGGFDVLGSLRQFAGLDRLALGSDEQSNLAISAGKYISRDVYLEVVGGGREGPTAEIQWRIKRGLSLVSQIGSTRGAKVAVRWSRDIGAPKKDTAP